MKRFRLGVAFGIFLLCFIIPCPSVFAVPASPDVSTVKQPDGTTFRARNVGDEWANVTETDMGYPVARNKKTKFWEYATLSPSVGLQPSGKVVGKDFPAGISKISVMELKAFGPQKAQGAPGFSPPPPSGAPFNNTGTHKVLVILVEFTDKALTTTEANWNTNVFGGAGSVKDYYTEVSYSQLTLAPAEESYGAANNGVVVVNVGYAHPNTGGSTGDANKQLTKDAVLAADGFVNYASFDSNSDGSIQSNELHVVIIPAGYEAALSGAPAPNIWAHQWCVFGAVTAPVVDGKTITQCTNGGYTQFGELHHAPGDHMATIGIIAHELGHDLGLPDLYDTDDSSNGVGDWSVMGGGSWNGAVNSGDTPAHFDAWCKWREGWVVPTQIKEPVTGKSLPRVETASGPNYGIFYLLNNPNDVEQGGTGEYFLIENRQQTGYDSQLPGNGLLIWHIDETRTGNSNEAQKLVDLEEAEGVQELDVKTNQGDPQDPYYNGNNTTFNDASTPNSKLYSGAASGVSVTNISVSGATMTADVTVPDIQPPGAPTLVSPPNFSGTSDNTPAFDWSDVTDGSGVTYDLLADNNSGFSSPEINQTGIAVSTYTPGAPLADGLYYWKVRAVDGAANNGNYSSVFQVTINTTDGTPPSAPAAVNDGTGSDIDFVSSLTQLSAIWVAATDAESGIARYFHRIYKVVGAIDAGCGDVDDTAIPEMPGWEDAGALLSTTKSGLTLTEGSTYYFCVKAENGAGLLGPELRSDGQKVDTVLPVTALNGDNPDPFSPDGDAVSDTTSFGLTAADPGSGVLDWTLNIYDGPTCITLYKGFSGTGDPPANKVWDGKNDSGKLLPNTDYCVKYIVRDTALNSVTIQSDPTADGFTPGGPGIYVQSEPMISSNATATAWHQSHKLVRNGTRINIVYAGNGEIYYASSTDEGTSWTKPTNISNTADDSDFPAIAIDASNNLHVVWQENVGAANKEIYYVKVTPAAVNPFSGTPVNISNTSGASNASEFPSIAVDTSGWLHVVWRDNTTGFATGANPDIAWSLSTNGGTSWSAPSNLSSSTGISSGASIAAGGSNRAYVAWWDDTTGNNEIMYKRYSGGSWDVSATNVSNTAPGSSLEPAVAVDSANNVHVVWQDDVDGDNDIYYKMYNGTAWDGSSTNVSNNGFDSSEPNIGFDSSTNDVVAAWMDNATGSYEIYYKKKGSYGWNVNFYNVSQTGGVDSKYPSLNLKATTLGIDVVWTEGNGPAYTIKYGKVDTISPNVTSLTSPSHPSQAIWYNDNTPQWDFTGADNALGTGLFGSWRLINTTSTETPLNLRNTGTYQGAGVVTYTSGALADGIQYFHLIYEDNAGNLSTVSAYTTRVDTSPPVALAAPNDGTGADVDIWYQGTYFSANWAATTDPHSGVTKYLSAVFQAVGACGAGGGADIQIDGWDDNGLNLSTTHSGLALTPGTTYCIGVKALNSVPLETAIAESDGAVYTIDVTPPADIATLNDGTGSDIDVTGSTTQLSANWTASSDGETGVAKYWYAIYQKQGSFIDPGGGEADDTTIVGFTDNGTSANVTKTGLTLTAGQLYYFGVKAENGVGLQSNVTKSDGVSVDSTAPDAALANVYDGDNAGFDTDLAPLATQGTLSANWSGFTDASPGIAKFWYAIGTSPSVQNVLGWTEVAVAPPDTAPPPATVTKTGLTLSHNTIYYFQVKAEDGVGYQSSVKASSGQKADLQGPAVSSLTSSTHSSQSTWYANQLPSYSWESSDGAGESGWRSCYRLLDQTASQSASTVKAANLPEAQNGSFTVGGAIAEGIWYFHLVCEDVFYNLGAVATHTTRIDVTQPTAPANVYDGAGADIATTAYLDELSANWTASTDGLSSIAKYWYAIYERAGTCIDGAGPCVETDDVSIVSFYDNGTATNVTDTTVALTSGKTYYFSVKAQDGAGNYSAVTKSDGVTANNNGPTILTLTSSTHPTQTSWYTSNLPSYAWTEQDNGGSGVAKYWVALNTTASMTASQIKAANQPIIHPIKAFTQGTPKTDGTYYFHLIAEDNNGMLSPSETKYVTKIDASGPTTMTAVYDGASTGLDAAYASLSTSLSANWTASSDAQSGIAKYFYAIYQKQGTCIDNANGGTGCAEVNDTSVLGYTDNGTDTSVTKTGLTLTDGQVYYFSVKAQNGSGIQGTPKASNGATIDSTPPSTPSFVYDGTGADLTFTSSVDTLSANWATSTDAQTNVAKYYYAVYKQNGTCVDGGTCVETDDASVVSFTSTGTTRSVTKTGLTLSSGSAYYFAVKAENGAGGQSSVTNSNGITVDATAPAFSSLTSSTHPTESGFYSSTKPSLSWAASDNSGGSGINKYYYLLNQSTSETASNVKTTGAQGAAATFTQGTALADGTHYFHLVVDDAMGNLSTVSRYALNIDTTAPAISAIGKAPSAGTAVITWTTNEAADSTVEHGTTTAYGTTSADAALVTNHSVTITGLTGGATYHFRVQSKDAAGNTATSADDTFTADTDTSAPTLTSVTSTTHPDSTKWVNDAKPSVTWTATDDKGISGAYLLFDSTSSQLATTVFASGTFKAYDTTSTDPTTGIVTASGAYAQPTNLTDGTWYAHVVAKDAGDNLSSVKDYKLQIDTSPPADMTIYDGTGDDIDYTSSKTTLSATWSPASDPQSGVAKYYFAVGTTPGGTDVVNYDSAGSLTSTTKAGLSLIEGKTYYVSVKAENASGLMSNVATTDGVIVDATAPKALSSAASNETTVTVTFNEAMDKTSAETASNYIITPSLSVSKAVLGSDTKTVTLTTSSQAVGKNYTITLGSVKDLAGNTVSSSSNSVSFKGRKTKTFAAGKTLISLPFIPDSPDPAVFFGIPVCTSQITSNCFTLKSYDPSASTVKSYPDAFVTGLEIQKGYMLILTSSIPPVNVTGTAVAQDAASPYRTVSLKPGWNLIGIPFDTPSDKNIKISELTIIKDGVIKTLEEAENNWWVGAFLWTYYEGSYKLVHASIPGASRYVEPWRGYLIYAVASCTLVFPVSSPSKAKEGAVPFVGGINWSVQIAAKTPYAKDDANFGGVVKTARNWFVAEPPMEDDSEPYVRVYFEDKGKKLTSFYKTGRNKDESISFIVEANAKAGENVELSFAFTGNLEGMDVLLTDEKAGKTAPLSKDASYSYVNDGAARTFKIEVKDKAKEEAKNRPLNITQLHNYPNPDRVGNTTFKYAVDGNVAFVMIEVYTMTGKVIEKFAGELDGDTVWKFGDSLPNGVYIYRLVVTDVNGNKTSKVSKLVVLK